MGSALSILQTPQSGHYITFSHFVIYPAFNPCVNFPHFISMPLHSVEKLDTVLIVCLKHPLSSDHLVSFHFLLISCTPLYKN